MAFISGLWVFNKDIIFGITDGYVTEQIQINFTSNGKSYIGMSVYNNNQSIYYVSASGQLTEAYAEHTTYPGWVYDSYRTVDFGETEQEVSEDLYKWFQKNAKHTIVYDEQYAIRYATLLSIANAIRAKTGHTDLIDASDMADMIERIEGGGIAPSGTLSITENGTYDVTDYARAEVSVQGGSGASDLAIQLISDRTSLTSVDIPSGVTKIESSAFSWCTSLVAVSFPNSLTTINNDAFEYCQQLYLTSLPDSVTHIKSGAFSGCNNVNFITLPPRLVEIGSQNLSYYQQSDILFPSSLETIGDYLFGFSNSTLTTATFEGTPTDAGRSIFYGCSGLTDIYVPWAEGEVANAPWGATNATIHYNHTV